MTKKKTFFYFFLLGSSSGEIKCIDVRSGNIINQQKLPQGQ